MMTRDGEVIGARVTRHQNRNYLRRHTGAALEPERPPQLHILQHGREDNQEPHSNHKAIQRARVSTLQESAYLWQG